MIDYNIFYKEVILDKKLNHCEEYDIFISAFNLSHRISQVFKTIVAREKYWLIFPQYSIQAAEYPTEGKIFRSDFINEEEYIPSLMTMIGSLNNKKICIDITGFLRPHLIFLIKYLHTMGVKYFDAIYSEPNFYFHREKTEFSKKLVTTIKQIPGFSADRNNPKSNNDILIIGGGYDDQLISKVANNKKHCKKYQIIGFPSLQIDMYQENILRIENAKEDLGDNVINFFAPANDPFVTANTIREIVDKNLDYSNIYLCPVGTKPQVLGFAIYYIYECSNKAISIIFPYSQEYSSKTSEGISKTLCYKVELP